MKPRLIIFGGSFDPPHLGHVMSVASLIEDDPDSWVVVMPTFDHTHGKLMRPFEDRFAMCQQAMSIFGRGVKVSDFEARHQPPNTKALLHMLREQYPTFSLVLAVGADCWRDRMKWHCWDLIEERVNIRVLGRQGVDVDLPVPVVLLPDISSSAIREGIREGDVEGIKHLLPPGVLSMILVNGWYI